MPPESIRRPGWGPQASGFTLIELLVVLSIIALMLTVALPRYFQSVEHSKEAVLQENLKVLRTTIDRFHGDTGRYPDTLEELVSRHYLRAIPADPITGSATTWLSLPSSNPELKGVFDVKSGAPGTSRQGTAFGEM